MSHCRGHHGTAIPARVYRPPTAQCTDSQSRPGNACRSPLQTESAPESPACFPDNAESFFMSLRHQLTAYSPLSAQSALAALGQVLRSRPDPRPSLQVRLRARYGSGNAFLFGSGTQALSAAIREAVEQTADKRVSVGIPAFSCYDIGTAVIGADVRVRFYDLDPATLAPEP